jgi:tyrosine-protein kinase Etk/Wzc
MSSVTNKSSSKDSDEIDLGRLIGELIDHRKLIISLTSFFTLLAIIYALFSTPVFQLMHWSKLSKNKVMLC